MPEITVISGKGGTGKTSLAAAFAKLAANHVICDLDVDVPDMHLLLRPEVVEVHEFRAGRTAKIDPAACILCSDCHDRCRFGAIARTAMGYEVDDTACGGCGVCAHFCPAQAIVMVPRRSGEWYWSRTEAGPMIHAQLRPGAENSGLLVSVLRREAKAECERTGRDIIIADGPPGIGCPVISAISGTDYVAMVTEPTPSGLHDLARAVDLCAHFGRRAGVIINKFDLDLTRTAEVEGFCAGHGLPVVARIPYDQAVVEALMVGLTMADLTGHRIGDAARSAWKGIRAEAQSSRATAIAPS